MADIAFASEVFLTFAAPYLKDCPNALVAHHLKLAARNLQAHPRLRRFHSADQRAGDGRRLRAREPGRRDRGLRGAGGDVREPPHRPDHARACSAPLRRHLESTLTPEPECYLLDDEDTLRLLPTPTLALAAGLKVRAAVQPTMSAAGLLDRLVNRYGDVVGYGALFDLMSIPDRPYSSERGAVKYGSFYNDRATDVQIAVNKRYSDIAETVEFSGLLWGR